MKLYLIKRRDTKQFLRTLEAHYSLHSGQDKIAWSDTPAMMLRTADGVAMNLRKLCSEAFWQNESNRSNIGWKNFDAAKLEGYEVVCMDVDIVSMTATPATEFAQITKIADIPLTYEERHAA